MKILLLFIILLNIYKLSNCNEFEINKQIKSPIITNVTSALIIHQDDSSPYLNVYVSGIFSQKKMNLTVYLNDEIIENYKYQHDNNKNNTSPDLIIFKLYREGIVPGNITLEYSDAEIKSNQMPLVLESYIYYTKNPDVTGGILTLNGYFYYVNYSSAPIVKIGNKTTCEVLQYDNGFIKCLVAESKNINHGDSISISNIYNYQNSSLEFEYGSPVIDRVLNVDRIQESLITLVGNNFNEKDSNDLQIYIYEEKSDSKRLCSKPILITNSVIICTLNKSDYQTLKGDTIYILLNNQQQQKQQQLTEFNILSIENNNNNGKSNSNGNSIKSNKYLLLAIIIPTIIVFIFTIVLIIFIFKKKNQNSYFNLMNCSSELQETSYY